MDLNDLPVDDLARLAFYQRSRANEEERERVREALEKPASERSALDEVWIAYSPYGSGQSCHRTGFYLG